MQWWWVFEFCLHYRDCQLISSNPWFHYYRPGVCIFSKIISFHQKLEVWREGKTFFFMVLFDRSGKLIISNGRLINIWEKVIKRLKNLPFEYKFLIFPQDHQKTLLIIVNPASDRWLNAFSKNFKFLFEKITFCYFSSKR